MANDAADALREKLRRYRYLHRMLDDAALRAALDEEIAELERRLEALGAPGAQGC